MRLRTCRCLVVMLVIAGVTAAGANGGRLVDAVKAGDATAVKATLARRVDVNAPEPDGATALQWAVERDDLGIADLLLRAGASANVSNMYGVTPLHSACLNGSAAMVEKLLAAGAKVDAAVSAGETPLMTAAGAGSLGAITALIGHGADLNAHESSKGQTALMWAIAENHIDVVRALVAAGADVHARSTGGFTPLLFAARGSDVSMTELLVSAGADVNEPTPDKGTALMLAALSSNEPVALFLLEHGANPNAADPVGMTPLHAAVWRQRGQMALVQALLARGANPNARLTKAPPRLPWELAISSDFLVGSTPFLLAANELDAPMMRALAAGGADPLIATTENTGPLMVAAGRGYFIGTKSATLYDRSLESGLAAVKVAVELGADVNAVNKWGETALHAAANNGADNIIQYLAERGANVNVKDDHGRTPLFVSRHAQQAGTEHEYKSSAALLLKYGAVDDPKQEALGVLPWLFGVR